MALLESIVALWSVAGNVSTAIGLASRTKDILNFFKDRKSLEDVLAELVAEEFQNRLPRMQKLCPDGEPEFDKVFFSKVITNHNFKLSTTDDLLPQLLPYLANSISAPGSPYGDAEWYPIFQAILYAAIRGMWKKLSGYNKLTNQINLEQGDIIIRQQEDLNTDLGNRLDRMEDSLNEIKNNIQSFSSFAEFVWAGAYNKLVAISPPAEDTIDKVAYRNPFTLVRAEDFNHNYKKLASLFYDSPSWDAIQSRTDNVFIEGGRGTGKSMLLRRLSAQATIANMRFKNEKATFDDITDEYFGVYIKLFRGSYDRIDPVDKIEPEIASRLAEQELNIEIFDAFVGTLRWLDQERALPLSMSRNALDNMVKELALLFPKGPSVDTLDDLRKIVHFEQDQINNFLKGKAFRNQYTYNGSYVSTPTFIQRLSRICREHLFPKTDMRLFLLIDEFEALLDIQQIALNTVIKNRFPDVTLKIAVRRLGRKTMETFLVEDPIQEPRDYREVILDFDMNPRLYQDFLEGIAAKRLSEAGYLQTEIRNYLEPPILDEEVPRNEIEIELGKIWKNLKYPEDQMSEDFRNKYYSTALYRALFRLSTRKAFVGFEQYALLSSGIVSNFIELCQYAFYFAIADGLPLRDNPRISTYLQNEAAYRVSGRLFSKIDSNVPIIGSTLATLLSHLGAILYSRLLLHSSEPEVNRIELEGFDESSKREYKKLAQVIDGASVWSIFHVKESKDGFYPANSLRQSIVELTINRIYTPFLKISPTGKWKISINPENLAKLIDPDTRDQEFDHLLKSIGAENDVKLY